MTVSASRAISIASKLRPSQLSGLADARMAAHRQARSWRCLWQIGWTARHWPPGFPLGGGWLLGLAPLRLPDLALLPFVRASSAWPPPAGASDNEPGLGPSQHLALERFLASGSFLGG